MFACFPSSEIYLLSFVVCMLSQNKNIFLPLKYIENINKNILNNFLIAAPCSTHILFFQKLPSPAPTPTPESGNTLVLHWFFGYGYN